MGCLPSQAAVIVVLTLFCVTITSAGTLGQACNETEAFSCTGSNEICDSEFCKCNVTAGYTDVSGECKLDIPMVVISQKPIEKDATVTISCTVTTELNSTVISVEWFRNDIFLNTTDSGKYSGGNVTTPSLSIHSLVSNDGGEYRCGATNQYGSANSTEYVTLAAPSAVKIDVSNNQVNHNDSVTFNGSYYSILTMVTIEWQKQEGSVYKEINISESRYFGSTNSGPNPKLVINSVMFTDETRYRLVVSNRVGSTPGSEILLDVTGGELTVTTGANVTGRVGGNVTVDCNITGPELDSVLWKKYTLDNTNGVNLTTHVGTKYTGGSISTPALTINNLEEADAADYKCIASNPGGSYSSSNKATVTVVYGQFNENCSETELCDSSENLECSSKKCLCDSTFYHKDKICYPKAGLTPNITQLSSTTSELNVMWSHPIIQDHLGLVTEYEVYRRVGQGSNMSSGRIDNKLNSHTVSSGLVPGQLYTVFVNAYVNLNDPVKSFTVTSPDQTVRLVPLPPGDIDRNRSNFTLDNLHIVWTAPINDTVVNNYEVTIQTKKEITSDNATSINFNAAQLLVPGVYYNVTIVTVSGTANDIVKNSSPTTERFRTTPTKPEPPTGVICTQELGNSIEISWNAPSKPNGLIHFYQIYISPQPQGIPGPINTSTNATEFKVDNLKEEQEYTFTVSTLNDAKDSISINATHKTCKTKAGASGPPTKLNVINVQSRKFEIKFEAPEDVKGVLAAYKIMISEGKNCVQQILLIGTEECPNCTSTIYCPQLKNFTVANISLPVAHTVSGLKPYTKYLVEVAAVNGQGEGHRANATEMTEEEIPLKPEKITAEIFNATSLTLSWNISDPSPGNTTYTIYVYESTDDKETSFTLNQTLKSYGFINKSVQVYDLEEYWPYYFEVDAATMKGNNKSDRSTTVRTSQAAPGMVVGLSVNMKGEDDRKAYVSWSLPPLREHNGVLKNYVFKSNFSGNSDEYDIPVNLSRQKEERIFDVIPETVYEIEVALENNKSEKGKPSKNFYTAKAGHMKPEDKPFPLGIVVGVACAAVAVALVIGAVIIFRSRRSSLGRTKSYTKGLHDPPDTEDPVSKNIPRKRPIKLKELADKVAEKHKDSNLHFAREYDDLKALCAKHSTETSETDSNKLKNRYVNILPFDHSRVKLMLTEDDDPSTDFINANYLPGYKSPREYIATQGPIPGTIDDFWRMIWEQNVSIIVMLTLCKEEGRVKCEMYWPENTNEPKQYGDLVVETVSNSTVNFYDFRIFKIKLGDTTRSVKHFHFLQWKDFSANVQNDVMIDFIKNVRNHIRPPDMNGPVVVHCSAGVGRTGTYCALDHLFQFIDEHELDESIDIFDLVMNLREQRMCMVQTEQQYVFIHDCVRDYVERKQREMNGNQLYENVNRAFVHDDVEEDESLYQNYNNQRTDL